jgi:hypothetical protein
VNGRGSANSRLSIALGLLAVLFFLLLVAESVREEVYLRLLESEWPVMEPGAPAVAIHELAWDDHPLKFIGLFTEDRDRRLRVGTIQAQFPARPAASYDASCGFSCQNALVIPLRCGGPQYPLFGDTACQLHLWQLEDGGRVCFFSLADVVGVEGVLAKSTAATLGLPVAPPDVHLHCPTLRWQHP